MYTRHRRLIKDDSSDSEPDAEVEKARRRWAARSAPAADAAAATPKKKKKKRLPPQETIDQLWERFAQKRFSKAMAVLPFAPVAPSPLSHRANELLSLGYERAAEECRRKVRKIIQECRRVNMRYRDPGWDIDWDLKMGKGHCLNSLGRSAFDVGMKNMLSLSASVPKAVKRVHEIFEKPTFMKTVSGSDIKQGSLGDCWFISCVSGLANVPGGLQRVCVEYDTKIGIYGFVFYRDGEWIYSIIDDKLYLTSPSWDSPSFQRDLLQQIDQENIESVYRKTYQTGSKALFFAQNKDQNETWLPLMEKAYAKAHGDYDSLTGGWIGEGLEDLTGGVTTELLMSDIFDTDSFWERELSRVNEEFLFGCTTGLLDGGYGDRDGITEGHAYNIMEARTLKNGTRLLKLRNPWGKVKAGTWEGAWSDGSKEWTTEVKEELGHTFGSDSTFWIAYEDFLLKYQHVDRTRLFRDPDWRCCQRWIGVDVPWKTSYNEKFHIKLTQASPVVLVLSQLDARYFQGLVGQYFFRLHFRLHEQDRPDAEDYIVRSHGNYLMDRAVSVELPCLEAGNYSVFLSVVAERSSSMLSVEDVVKRELKSRVENEKLAQVGQAYDLAHSKAAAHMQELAKLRKKSDYAKASEERKRERRKAWEKRHLLKDIQARQHKKDDAKNKKRAAAAEEAAKKEAALRPQDKEAQTELPPPACTDKAVQADLTPAAAAEPPPEVELVSASASGVSTPQKTPLDTPKSEIMTEPALDAEAGGLLIAPPDADADGAAFKETESPGEQSGEKAETKGADKGTGDYKKTDEKNVEKKEMKKEGTKVEKGIQTDEVAAPKVDDSSDSPIEDWEEWYSSDDLSTKASRAAAAANLPGAAGAAAKEEDDSEDEKDPVPWNAICVVGIRVYSKDEHLELRVVMEGGNLSEGGMGERGEQDLDNAQANAGGQRVRKEPGGERADDKGTETDRERREKKAGQDKKEEGKKTKENEQEGDEKTKKAAAEQGGEKKTEEEKGDKKSAVAETTGTDVPADASKSSDGTEDAVSKKEDVVGSKEDAVDSKAEETAAAAVASPAETPATTVTSTSPDSGLAQYTTIVQKDGEEFERASAPVAPVETAETVKTAETTETAKTAETAETAQPDVIAVVDTMLWG